MKITIEIHDLSEWAAVALMAQRVAGTVETAEFAPAALGVQSASANTEKRKPGRQKQAAAAAQAATGAQAAAAQGAPAISDPWPAQLGGEPAAQPTASGHTPEQLAAVADAVTAAANLIKADPAVLGAQVRDVLTKLAKAGKTMAVKSLLKEFGAEGLSLLDPNKYQEVLDKAALL